MIDFQNASYMKLSQVPVADIQAQVADLLVEGEQVCTAYRGLRDYIVFTNKRIIAVNIVAVSVQGTIGKKRDYTSLPFSKVQAFSLETAGNLDAELALWFSGLGKVRFEFNGNADVAYLNRLVGTYVL